MTLARVAIGCLLLLAPTLGGCGKMGYLEQPAPLYGAKAKADWKARQAAEAAGRAPAPEQPLPEALAPPEPGAATPVPEPTPEKTPPPQ
jgi:hypothetical protein